MTNSSVTGTIAISSGGIIKSTGLIFATKSSPPGRKARTLVPRGRGRAPERGRSESSRSRSPSFRRGAAPGERGRRVASSSTAVAPSRYATSTSHNSESYHFFGKTAVADIENEVRRVLNDPAGQDLARVTALLESFKLQLSPESAQLLAVGIGVTARIVTRTAQDYHMVRSSTAPLVKHAADEMHARLARWRRGITNASTGVARTEPTEVKTKAPSNKGSGEQKAAQKRARETRKFYLHHPKLPASN